MTFVAAASTCNLKASSTKAVSIADTTLSSGNFIGIGTDQGEVLIYGVSGTNAGQCQNLTAAGKVAPSGYNFGSAVGVLSFTGTASNNYGYFGTQNGQIWRIIASTSNVPQAFTQINGSTFINPPTSNLTALYSDSNNNVYVGTGNGVIYLLAPFNSSGGVNTTWTTFQLLKSSGTPDTSAITSISATTSGVVIAVTANGVYNVTTY